LLCIVITIAFANGDGAMETETVPQRYWCHGMRALLPPSILIREAALIMMLMGHLVGYILNIPFGTEVDGVVIVVLCVKAMH
jgi:hypothetical protein